MGICMADLPIVLIIWSMKKVIYYQLECGKNFTNISTECIFSLDDDWSIQSKRQQSFVQAQVGNR